MTSTLSQATHLKSSFVNGITNSPIASNMMKAMKTVGSFIPKTSMTTMLPIIGLSTILCYDKITKVIEKSFLNNIPVPLPTGLKNGFKELSDELKKASPKYRTTLHNAFKLLIKHADKPLHSAVQQTRIVPEVGVPIMASTLLGLASFVFPKVKILQDFNNMVFSGLKFMVPVVATGAVLTPLYMIARSIQSMSPQAIVAANEKATKIKLKGEGYEPLEATIWDKDKEEDKKKIEEYKNKPLHYPDAVDEKIKEFETILQAPKVGKSDLQAFTFYGPPGTGKTSIMNKLSAIVTDTVKGTTHHYQISSKDLKQFDWKLDQLTKFVKGEKLDDFYKLENKNTFINIANPFSSRSGNNNFKTDLDAICIQIDEADQMEADNLARLQSTITKLEESGQKVVIFMTTNNLKQIPLAMQRRVTPLEIGFPDEKQKKFILKENIEKLTVGGEQVFNNPENASPLITALNTAFTDSNGLKTTGIMGDHIVKSLISAIQLSGASIDDIKNNSKTNDIAKKFMEKMKECVASLSQPSQS